MPRTGAPRLAVLSWLLHCAGALSKQVTDTTVSNQQPAKEGGPIKRKKATSLGALIETGVIKDGAVLRYMKVTACMSSGTVREHIAQSMAGLRPSQEAPHCMAWGSRHSRPGQLHMKGK